MTILPISKRLDNFLDPFQWVERLRGYLMPAPFWIKDLGKRGEYWARRHYHRKGYHLLAKNWRHGKGEVDVIMARSRSLLFLEVKTRRHLPGEDIRDSLHHEQQKRLEQLIAVYRQTKLVQDAPWAFILVRILADKEGFSLKTARL